METDPYKKYLDDLQRSSGWSDLAEIMIAMIMQNANEDEAYGFLNEAGIRLAKTNPLPETKKLADLMLNMNTRLESFKWGRVLIEDKGHCLLLKHDFLPQAKNAEEKIWVQGFACLLSGLYSQWLRQSGAPDTLTLSLDKIVSPSALNFVLRREP